MRVDTMKNGFAGAALGGFAAGRAQPAGDLRLQCLAMARRRAVLAGLSSLLPIPGVDLVTDVALLMAIVEEVTRRYGLSHAQIDALSPARKALAYRLTTSAGGFLAAHLTASRTFSLILQRAGLRLGFAEASRLAPLIGQCVAAVIGYATLMRLARRHIDQCQAIAAQINGG